MGSLSKYMPTVENFSTPASPVDAPAMPSPKKASPLASFMPAQVLPESADYETSLNPEEEKEFQQWKSVQAPNDSGVDYDYRGAFKEGAMADQSSHWPDTFKKPTHPTFSTDSMYAKDDPDLAGKWEGEKFIPSANQLREREKQHFANDPYHQLIAKSIGHKPLLGHILKDLPRAAKQEARDAEPIGAIKVLGQAMKNVIPELRRSFLAMHKGKDGVDILSDWSKDMEKMQKKSKALARNTQTMFGDKNILPFVPIKVSDVAQLPESMAYSLASMGTGVAVGAPIAFAPVVGARPLAWATGTAASGKAAYEMSTYSIMESFLQIKNQQFIKEKGREITQAEQAKFKKSFDQKAMKYGLWEAIPEAVSNLAFASVIGGPLTKVMNDMGMKGATTQILTKLGSIYGEELATETITALGQAPIEESAGMRAPGTGQLTPWQALKEIAPQTFLLSTILGGTGVSVVAAKNRIAKSLKKEVGPEKALQLLLEEALNEEESFADQLDAAEVGQKVEDILLKQMGLQPEVAVPGVAMPGVAPVVPGVQAEVAPPIPTVPGVGNLEKIDIAKLEEQVEMEKNISKSIRREGLSGDKNIEAGVIIKQSDSQTFYVYEK